MFAQQTHHHNSHHLFQNSLSNSMACMKLLTQKRNLNLIVILLSFSFLLMSSFNPSQFMAQGRQLPNANPMKEEEEFAVEMRGLIGSRPPKCEGRCRNCGHCEAVQVPIAAAGSIKKLLGQEIIRRIEYSRGDDISNYKPMCWKCKCGDFFFNP